MILIVSSFSLLVIVAGMFLLAKTLKDGLSNMFKYISYFVILCGFFSLFAGGAVFMVKKCMRHCQMENQFKGERNFGNCDHGRGGHEGCGRREMCEEGEGEICIEGKGGEMRVEKSIIINGQEMTKVECEKSGAKDCCKNKMMKKDSVIIKK